MPVPTVQTEFPHSSRGGRGTITLLCRNSGVCSLPAARLKTHNQGPWQAGLPIPGSPYQKKHCQDTHSVKMHFTSLSTTYVYSLPQAQLTLSLLTNLRDSSAPGTKHPDVTACPAPSLSSLRPYRCTSNQPQTPGSNRNSRLFPTFLSLKHAPSVFRANGFPSYKTQLNCPSSRKQVIFFHWATPAHYHGSWCLQTCLYPSFTMSPCGCTF